MKKTFKLEELECASCAAKMENAISKIDGVENVSINFMSSRMILEADDTRFDSIVQAAQKVVKKIEPDVKIIA